MPKTGTKSTFLIWANKDDLPNDIATEFGHISSLKINLIPLSTSKQNVETSEPLLQLIFSDIYRKHEHGVCALHQNPHLAFISQ